MNLTFLVVAIIIGTAVDWIFQSKRQGESKTQDMGALIDHCFAYSILTTWLLVVFGILSIGVITFLIWAILLSTHAIIDNRLLVKFIMYMKDLTWEEVNSKEYAWMQLGIDQILHSLVILYIAMAVL